MTRSRTLTTMMALAVAGAVATGAVYAQQPDGQNAPQQRMRRPGPGGPFGPGPGSERGPMGLMLPLRQLDLSEAQHEQVRGILQSHRDELVATAEKVRAAAKAQHDAITAVPFDEGAIRELSAAFAAAQSDAAVLHARVHSEVFAVLTPEQQAKAKEFEAAREKRMSEVRQRVRSRVQQRQARPQA